MAAWHWLASWEAVAVLLGVAYLLLAARESLWCWYAAFASTAIFLVLFWQVRLYLESALQVYYLAMAVYGWWQWQRPGEARTLAISRFGARAHGLVIGGVLALSALSGALLSRYTDAALPYLDAFTTWGAIVTTWMVARKILENWLYWIVIDSASIVLYLDRGLLLTAALFAAYVVICIAGFLAWRRHYRVAAAVSG
ncbi:nicotinamide riboside transporter PnuC [Pseudohaliea rubra]|uniref:Nicotinamide riboside transporter PnuC n=1 Tax=Pseudohaliea rubra DSM 19751 TaxID=1265313 RepID=A0A095VPR2_9GAMM|nr:nicotinamide riboside transporter PnuC [Pseudohaliea rubra]KGE03385.1 putative thiamin transporter PnuT [Pseudohaliea rubra DSM 19751]